MQRVKRISVCAIAVSKSHEFLLKVRRLSSFFFDDDAYAFTSTRRIFFHDVAHYATSSPVSAWIGDWRVLWRVYHSGIYPGQLSLAVPLWVGAMSTGDGFGHLWEETAPLKLRPYGAL